MMNSYTKNIWDIAPGLLLIKEAGALVLNLEGKPYNLYDCGMVVYANEAFIAYLTNKPALLKELILIDNDY